MSTLANEWELLLKEHGKKMIVDDAAIHALTRLGFRVKGYSWVIDSYQGTPRAFVPVKEIRAKFFYTVQYWLDLEQINFYLTKGTKTLPYLIQDKSSRYWLWDGHHRLIARRIAGYRIYAFVGDAEK